MWTLYLSDGLVLPSTGFERYCRKNVYIGVVFDANDQLKETHEKNNIIVTSSTLPVKLTNCLPIVKKCKFVCVHKVLPNSTKRYE